MPKYTDGYTTTVSLVLYDVEMWGTRLLQCAVRPKTFEEEKVQNRGFQPSPKIVQDSKWMSNAGWRDKMAIYYRRIVKRALQPLTSLSSSLAGHDLTAVGLFELGYQRQVRRVLPTSVYAPLEHSRSGPIRRR